MNKKDKISLGINIIIGTVLIIIGISIDLEYYSTIIFAMGFALVFNSIVHLAIYYYNTRPENIEVYKEKVHRQNIDIKDERKIQIRFCSGYITWAITMICCFIASFAAAMLKAGNTVVILLFSVGIAEYLVAFIVYKYLDKKCEIREIITKAKIIFA